MSELADVAIDNIHVPDRLREVDDAHVAAISKSIELHGLLHPITIRRTPNGKRKFSLVAGAHRLRSVAVLGEETIDAIIVKADGVEAAILEIEENLWRNDLSALDRAIFVQTYRQLWEKRNGKITRGGDQRVNLTLCPADALADAVGEGFTAACADRLGVSKATVKRANAIAQGLPTALRKRIAGTPIADNQSQLLALAKLPDDKRAKAAAALDEAEGDFAAAMDILTPKKKPNAQQKVLSQLIAGWSKATPATRRKFMAEAGLIAEGDDD